MIASSLIGHVIQLLEHIDAGTQPPDKITSEFFRAKKYLGARDRRFISEIVYGMIRHRKFIRTLISEYARIHTTAGTLEGPHIRYLSQYAAYIYAVEKNGIVPEHLWKTHFPNIDLDHFTSWLKENATLTFLPEDDITRLSVRYSFPEWFVRNIQDEWNTQTEQLLGALNTPAPIVLRVNSLKTTRDECRIRLQKEGIETVPSKFSPFGLMAQKRFNAQSLQSYKDGWFEIQDEGSQLVSLIADPKPDEMVIDGCAGAGGKTLHFSELMKNEGEIIAIDINAGKLYELMSRAKRAGITNIRTIANSHLQANEFTGKADIVLVDAPCSGTGTIRRNPGLKWSITESLIKNYNIKQSEILSFNSQFVKPGGKLIYATCSLLKSENEDIVNEFLSHNPEFHLEISKMNFSDIETPYIYLTSHTHGTDGFFIAVLKRVN